MSMSSLKFSQTESQDLLRISFKGRVDEDADFKELRVQKPQVELNLQGITLINSTGIRKWIAWIKEHGDKSITLVNCPQIFIEQLNMVAGLLPSGAKVLSFYVPYFSEESGEEKSILYSVGREIINGQVKVPDAVLDERGKQMEIDIYPEKYFKFVKLFT